MYKRLSRCQGRGERSSFSLRLVLLATLGLAFCGPSEIHFTVEQDNAIMQTLERQFVGAGAGATLTLCEDRATSDAWEPSSECQDVHVVRGGDRGAVHSEEAFSGPGCGGCPFAVLAYVKGTWQESPGATPVSVAGTVRFGDLYDVEEVFQHPYYLNLDCKSGDCSSITGNLQADGRIDVTVVSYASGGRKEQHVTLQSGNRVCQATPLKLSSSICRLLPPERSERDHVHMLISIPPKYSVSQVIGFIKGKTLKAL